MTLTLSGMRGSVVYEIKRNPDQTKLCRYRKRYSGKEDILDLEQGVACDSQWVVELMNNCGVAYWDGFHGAHPKNVSDGIMFFFKATVNDGQSISADGSENFPKGYREFVRALNEKLADSDKV